MWPQPFWPKSYWPGFYWPSNYIEMTVPKSRTLDVFSGGRTSPQAFPSKAPDGIKRYGFNFLPLLGKSVTVGTTDWRSIEGDLIFKTPQIVNGHLATVEISGGNEDQIYTATCRILTSDNETIEVGAPLQVRRQRW